MSIYTVRAHHDGQTITTVTPIADMLVALETMSELLAEYGDEGTTVDVIESAPGNLGDGVIVASETHAGVYA